MGTVLPFRSDSRDRLGEDAPQDGGCEIVIFPGVRIERRDKSAGPDEYSPFPGRTLDGSNGRRRPRKTS